MKKLFVSVGLAAAGTASLQIASAAALDVSQPDQRDWSVSASLRGFYDDNYDTLNNKKGSYGFEVTPTLEFSIPMQQTEFGMRYTYGLYYYQDRENAGINPIDQTHQVDLWLDHAFTERWEAKLQDTLAIGQEPELLQGSGTPFRANGNNIANTVTLSLNTDWTRLFSTTVTAINRFYDFQDTGGYADLFGYNSTTKTGDAFGPGLGSPFGPGQTPSAPFSTSGPAGTGNGNGAGLAGLLNRLDNSIALDLKWHVAPETTLLIGFMYDQVNYTGNEPVAYNPYYVGGTYLGPQNGPAFYYSDDRDNRSYAGYIGGEHQLLDNLSASVRVGVQYIDDYNDPLGTTTLAPYAVSSLVYTYLPGCYAQLGVSHSQNATDVVQVGTNGQITQAQESTAAFFTLNHQITSKLLGTLILSGQYSDFTGGAFTSQPDIDFNAGLNLKYAISKHFSGEFGYNYDNLQSGIDGRAYNRNRVYLGVGAAY